MLLSLCSIALLFCGHFNPGYGQLDAIQGAAAGAQLLNGGGPGGDLVKAVPKCNAPVDHSCDSMSFSDMAGKVAGNGFMDGATKGLISGGGLPSLGGRRRRAALFPKAPALPKAPVAPKAAAIKGAPKAPNLNNPLAANNFMKQSVPGTSYFADPKGMGCTSVQNKLQKCDQNTKKGGQFDTLKSMDFSKLTSPQAINAGDTCKKFMDTDKQQCEMLKRQCCAFMNGNVKDPSQFSCAFKDIISTAGKVQAQNSACDTTQKLLANPSNAGQTLQGGAKNAAGGLILAGAADKLTG